MAMDTPNDVASLVGPGPGERGGYPFAFRNPLTYTTLEAALGLEEETPDLRELIREWDTGQLNHEATFSEEMLEGMDPVFQTFLAAWLVDMQRPQPLGVGNIQLQTFMRLRGIETAESDYDIFYRIRAMKEILKYPTRPSSWQHPSAAEITAGSLIHVLGKHPVEAFFILSEYSTQMLFQLACVSDMVHRQLLLTLRCLEELEAMASYGRADTVTD